MIYLDSSVALAGLFLEDRSPPADFWRQPLISSRLLTYEVWNRVNARGDKPNKHDILTGSQPDGTAYPASPNLTCQNWTVGNADKLAGAAQVGHHDREGNSPGVSSWNSAHASRGCGQEDLKASGGDGLFYCFLAQ